MGKYQEALNTIKSIVWFDKRFEEFYKDELNILQQNIDDLEVYKKALRIAVANSQVRNIKGKFMEENCMKASDDYCERIGCVECIVNKSLEQARKELSNEKL